MILYSIAYGIVAWIASLSPFEELAISVLAMVVFLMLAIREILKGNEGEKLNPYWEKGADLQEGYPRWYD
jgi:hypothetical protein